MTATIAYSWPKENTSLRFTVVLEPGLTKLASLQIRVKASKKAVMAATQQNLNILETPMSLESICVCMTI